MNDLVGKLSGMLLLASLLCVAKSHAQQTKEPENMREVEAVRSVTKMLVMADLFRTQATTQSLVTVSCLSTEACAKKWMAEIVAKSGDRPGMVLADFFAGSVVFMGAATTGKSIVGFYNPWTDGILLGLLRVQGDSAVMEDFLFVTGEGFRGSPLTKGSALLALYYPEKPLLIELALRYAKTASLFEKRYPMQGDPRLLTPDLQESLQPQEVEWAYLLARQSYRMTMFAALTQEENKPFYQQIGKLLRALDGDMKGLEGVVSEQQRAAALDNLKLLPLSLRKNLAPHYMVKAKDGAIVGLVNPEFPRWVVIANYKGAMSAERTVSVEAFDLETSKKVIERMKGGKQ